MRPQALLAAIAVAAVSVTVLGCGRGPASTGTFPSRAEQSIRGVTVAVEAGPTEATDPYDLSAFRRTARPGYRLACIIGTADNGTDATIAVPARLATVLGDDGVKLDQWAGVRWIRTASGVRLEPRLVGGHFVPIDGVGPSGSVFHFVTYEYPASSREPITVVWTMGGGRRYVFHLRNP